MVCATSLRRTRHILDNRFTLSQLRSFTQPQVGADNVAKIADFGISKFVQGSDQRLQEQVIRITDWSAEVLYVVMMEQY